MGSAIRRGKHCLSNHDLILLPVPRERWLQDPTLVEAESDLNPARLYHAEPIASIIQTHRILHGSSNVPKAYPLCKAIDQRLFGLLDEGFAELVFMVLFNSNVLCFQRAGEFKQFLLMGGCTVVVLQGFRDFDRVKLDLVHKVCSIYLFLS